MKDRDRVGRESRDKLLAVRPKHRRRRLDDRNVDRPRDGREEKENDRERASRDSGLRNPDSHLFEMNDQGAAASFPGMIVERTTASIRPLCVFSSRRTGVPEAASSRTSAADSSAFAR